MKNLAKGIAISILALTTAGTALGQRNGRIGLGTQKLVLDYYGEHFRGTTTLKLKQKINQDIGGINLQHMTIKKIKLIAKTKLGKGTAQLKMGPNLSQKKTVDGLPQDFHDNDIYTFDMVKFKPMMTGTNRGVLQLLLKGNFKVDKVIIFVEQQQVRKFVLNYYGDQFRGQNTLTLKSELNYQHGVQANRFKLVKVKLVAKSKQGRGKASLIIGQSVTPISIVGGHPADFWEEDPITYDKIMMRNPSPRNSQGVWQIALKGNIRVSKVILFVVPKRLR